MFKKNQQLRKQINDLEKRVAKLERVPAEKMARAMGASLTKAKKLNGKKKDSTTAVITLSGRKKGMTVRDLAEAIDVDPAEARQRIFAACSMGLIENDGQRFTEGQRGKPPTVYRLTQ